jgi:hypothetical protein
LRPKVSGFPATCREFGCSRIAKRLQQKPDIAVAGNFRVFAQQQRSRTRKQIGMGSPALFTVASRLLRTVWRTRASAVLPRRNTHAREILCHRHGSRYCPAGLREWLIRLSLGFRRRIPLDRDGRRHFTPPWTCSARRHCPRPQPVRGSGRGIRNGSRQHFFVGAPIAGSDRACGHFLSRRRLRVAAAA